MELLEQLTAKLNSAKEGRIAIMNQLAAQDGYIQGIQETIALIAPEAPSVQEMPVVQQPHEKEA